VLDHLNYISGASFQPNISFPMDDWFYLYFSNLRRTLAAPNSFDYSRTVVNPNNPTVINSPPTQADLTLVATNLTAIRDGLLDISQQNYPGPADRLKALRNIWISPNMQTLKTIRKGTEASLYRFLGLGLFLSGFGKDTGAANSNIISQVPEFQALLKTI
jgi:hypothetical protein